MTNDHSRRGFLAAVGAGAAGVAGAAVLGGATSADAKTPTAQPATTVPADANEPLVAYVRDAHSGEVAVMVGEREVVVHDRELAARIARAAHGGK
jgi:FlaG/FlaF family flagellin (archaellin)